MGRKETWKEKFDWVFKRSSKTTWIGTQERADKGGVKGFFACYLLTSLSPRHKGHTYIGFTVNPRRRIRQHNGEIVSGAATTKKKRPWEMVMCIYGFPNNVSALKFEWAWQHPRESLAVGQAVASFKSLSGLGNKIKLAFTMLTLSKWQNLDLTVNFFSSKYTKHTAGCATLPDHMIVQICSMDELPCYTGIYNTHEDVREDEDRDDVDDNDGTSIKDTSTTEGLANITVESDLYYESIDKTFSHSGIDDSFNWTIDGLDDNDLVDKTDIMDSSTTEGLANITTESDMYNYKSIDETISNSGVDDSYDWTEDAGLFHWGIEDYRSEDDLTRSEDLSNSIEDSGQLDNKRIEETISCIGIDDSLNLTEDVGVFDLGIEKNSRHADLTRSDDLRSSIRDCGQLDSVIENMSELDHHPNEFCSDELAAKSPNICHEVEVIDLLSPSPRYNVGLKSKRRKVSRVIDLTRSPIFVEA